MNPAIYLPIIFLWIMILMMYRNKRRVTMLRNLIKKRKTGGDIEMKELAMRFIDKECLIYSFDGNRYQGIIKEISNGAVLVENKGAVEAINLDFIIRIREFVKK